MGSEALVNGHHAPPNLLHNHISKPWIVQKFGGTSVGKSPDQIVNNIVRDSLVSSRVAIVCSARSKNTKAEGTTNRLLRAAREAEDLNPHNYTNTVGLIRDDHIEATRSYICSPEISKTLSAAILQECQDLIVFLTAAQQIREMSHRSIDKIVSKGELLSASFLAALLQDRGIDSQVVDLSDIVSLAESSHLDRDFYARLAATLGSKIRACGEKVPVITGFFGAVSEGLLEQIGRGYTDLCAALVAVGLGAKELQVWKEVDGIFTADPRKVPTARLLLTITPAEAAELTFYGSEVIHPMTMEQAIQARIPVRIKNVMDPRGLGTIIQPEAVEGTTSAGAGHHLKLIRKRGASLSVEDQRPKRPTAITIKHNILVINIRSDKRSISHDFFTNIFSTLARWKLSVDLISTSEVNVSMALHFDSPLVTGGSDDEEKEIIHKELRGAVGELMQYGAVDLMDDMAILSLVGRQMKHMVGIAGKMFLILGENNVNIEMISQGASEINISCVLQERDADRALSILHTNLFTFWN